MLNYDNGWESNKDRMNMPRLKNDVNDLQLILKVMSGSNMEYAAEIFNRILNDFPALKEKVINSFSEDYVDIINSVKEFIGERLKNVRKKEEKNALFALLQACTYQQNNKKQNKVRDLLGFSKNFFYQNITKPNTSTYNHKPSYTRQRSDLSLLQEKCILEFCHSDESSGIDSNARREIEIMNADGTVEPHVG